MKRSIFLFFCCGLLLSAVFVLCGNDGVYNEETNREAVKKRKHTKDSLRKAERNRKDSVIDLRK